MSAISEYFRTALLIDDRVAADYEPLESIDHERAESNEHEPTAGLVEPPARDETPVHPAELVRAFLASGVVCSVLEPVEGASDIVQQALRGAEIADLLILDWLLYDSDVTTLEMINAIASERTERLTVIVVFTGMPGLGDVAQRLVDDAQFEALDEYSLRRGNTVVLVFGKPGVRLTDGDDRRQPSGYADLPGMICADLELVFKGLMPNFAFGGINALRQSAPRILATFNAGLDAGGLIHRMLLPEPSDAAAQFVRLLASEFEQVLHDRGIGDVWHIDASPDSRAQVRLTADLGEFTQQLKSLQPSRGLDETARAEVESELQRLKKLADDELVVEAVSRGFRQFDRTDLTQQAIKRAIPKATSSLVGGDASNRELAVLMNTAGIGKTAPRLELGIVLARRSRLALGAEQTAQDRTAGHGSDWDWWLCVQPLCDSVRLSGPRAFPLVPVRVGAGEFEAMIRPADGEPVGISFATNLHEVRQVRFSPSNAGAVVAQGDAANWFFTDEDDVRYDVVARLRPNLAAQAAQALGSAATRVGTDQSEWLRRGARS